VSSSLADAYRKARDCDPVSAFGGVIAFNHMVDLETAKEITSTFVEVIVAPEFAPDALEELKKKKDLRLLDIGPNIAGTPEGMDLKKVTAGSSTRTAISGRSPMSRLSRSLRSASPRMTSTTRSHSPGRSVST